MNKWLQYEHGDEGGASMHVPETLPGPPCDTCGAEIRDLALGMVGWNRSAFDGFHFFHKGNCDPVATGLHIDA